MCTCGMHINAWTACQSSAYLAFQRIFFSQTGTNSIIICVMKHTHSDLCRLRLGAFLVLNRKITARSYLYLVPFDTVLFSVSAFLYGSWYENGFAHHQMTGCKQCCCCCLSMSSHRRRKMPEDGENPAHKLEWNGKRYTAAAAAATALAPQMLSFLSSFF